MAPSTLVVCPSCRIKAGLAPGEPVKITFICPACNKPGTVGERLALPAHAQKKQEEKGCLQEILDLLLQLVMIPILLGGLWLIFYILRSSWPVWPFAAAALLGWTFTREGASPFAKATASTLLPVGLGLLTLCLALILLNATGDYWDPSGPMRIENQLVHAELKLREILDLRIFLCIVLALIVVNHFAPRWRVVTRFLAARDWTARVSLALLAVTSFTLGSHAVIQGWARDAHEQLENRYEANLRTQHQAELQEEISKSLQPIVRALKPADLNAFRALYEGLERAHRTTDPEIIGRIVRKSVAIAQQNQDVTQYLDSLKREGPGLAEPSLEEPASETDWQEQERRVQSTEDAALSAKTRAEQARAGLRSVLIEVAGMGLSGFGEFVDSYVENILDAWSEIIMERVVDRWPGEVKGLPRKVAAYLIHPENVFSKERTDQQSVDALVEQTRVELEQEKAEAIRVEMERVRVEREMKAREIRERPEFRAVP